MNSTGRIRSRGGPADDRGQRILRQMARELLLLQGSDWPFLLFTAQAKDYANQRFHHHHQRFQKLLWAAKDLADLNRLKDSELQSMEDVDSLWADIDYKPLSPPQLTASAATGTSPASIAEERGQIVSAQPGDSPRAIRYPNLLYKIFFAPPHVTRSPVTVFSGPSD